MKNMIKRLTAAASASAVLFCMAGCEEKNEHSDIWDDYGYVADEDLPYGSTMVRYTASADPSFKISIEFDDRFITKEEAIKLSDYIAALNTLDAELMEQTVYPVYLEYLKSIQGAVNTKAYIQDLHDNIQEGSAEGNEFDMDYIIVEEFYDESADDTIAEYSSLDMLLSDLSGGEVNITSRKMVSIDIFFSMNGEGSYSMKARQDSAPRLYIYEIDGQIYIL